MTRFRRSFASKSFGLSDRARIRDDDKFHAACLLACTGRNFLGEKEKQTGGRQRGVRATGIDRRQGARIHGHLEKCPNFHFLPSFLQPPLRRHVSPFARVLTRPKDDSARIIDSISSETYRRDVSRGYGNTRRKLMDNECYRKIKTIL